MGAESWAVDSGVRSGVGSPHTVAAHLRCDDVRVADADAARQRGSRVAAKPHAALREKLLTYALSLPEAEEHHPWGENVAKVGRRCASWATRRGAASSRLRGVR